MKAILLSIQPKWCELIASGRKTVEVRKTKPKLETPFKVYIYMTKGKWYKNNKKKWQHGSGKVIGEFVCDTFITDRTFGHDALLKAAACMSDVEAAVYCTNNEMYGWHISELVIYDKSLLLSDFKPPCDGFDKRCQVSCAKITIDGKSRCTRRQFTRPPQSWCYVAELAKGGEE